MSNRNEITPTKITDTFDKSVAYAVDGATVTIAISTQDPYTAKVTIKRRDAAHSEIVGRVIKEKIAPIIVFKRQLQELLVNLP